jgi:hypothetical protein
MAERTKQMLPKPLIPKSKHSAPCQAPNTMAERTKQMLPKPLIPKSKHSVQVGKDKGKGFGKDSGKAKGKDLAKGKGFGKASRASGSGGLSPAAVAEEVADAALVAVEDAITMAEEAMVAVEAMAEWDMAEKAIVKVETWAEEAMVEEAKAEESMAEIEAAEEAAEAAAEAAAAEALAEVFRAQGPGWETVYGQGYKAGWTAGVNACQRQNYERL